MNKMNLLFYPDSRVKRTRIGLALERMPEVYLCDIGELDIDIDAAFHWDFEDVNITPPVMEVMKHEIPTYNVKLNNVTKKRVDECFTEAFGYSSLIDDDHDGIFISKRNQQSRGDVQVLTPRPDPTFNEGFGRYAPGYRIAQKLIDTSDGNICTEYRFMKFDEHSFVMRKSKPVSKRFKSNAEKYECLQTDKVFTNEQQEKIDKFCKYMGLDFGEIDILPETGTGKLYIVDVNNIAGGSPFFLDLCKGKAIELYVECLRKMLQDAHKGITG